MLCYCSARLFCVLAILALSTGWTSALEKRSDDTPPLEAVVAQLTSRVQHLEASLSAVQTTVGRLDRHVAFRAGFHESELTTGINAGTVLHFHNVYLNDGNGYDVTSGFFTAPVDGTYAFFLRLQSHAGAHLAIYKEGRALAYNFVDDTDWENAASMATVTMKTGERVWVQVMEDSTEIRGSDRTLFTGFLVHAS